MTHVLGVLLLMLFIVEVIRRGRKHVRYVPPPKPEIIRSKKKGGWHDFDDEVLKDE